MNPWRIDPEDLTGFASARRVSVEVRRDGEVIYSSVPQPPAPKLPEPRVPQLHVEVVQQDWMPDDEAVLLDWQAYRLSDPSRHWRRWTVAEQMIAAIRYDTESWKNLIRITGID